MFREIGDSMRQIVWIMLVLVLSACAPGVKGSSSLNAVDLDEEDPKFTAGATWYVSNSWLTRDFDVDLPELRDLFQTYEGQTIRTNLPGFTAVQKGLPESWEFQLYATTGIQKVKEVNDTGSRVSVQWSERVVTTFVMHIPANTSPGVYTGSIVITKGEKVQFLPVKITVTGKGNQPSEIQSNRPSPVNLLAKT
jgi:hypothetical protein